VKGIKCKYCGRIYDSPSIMRTKKCHSHPKGAWCGYCTPSPLDESSWEAHRFFDAQRRRIEESEQRREKEKREEAAFLYEYKKHTPLLDCMLKKNSWEDDISECGLQIRGSDLRKLAIALANGINDKTKDAINTLYALRDGCDHVLNNVDAREDGSLGSWLEEIKWLKEELVNWNFWVSLCWLTKPISIKAAAADSTDNYENNRDDWNYWRLNSIAKLFHTRYVMPMLRVLRVLKAEPDEKDRAAMHEITSYVLSLPSKEKGFERCFEKMANQIKEPRFWSVLYCLYWMQLRPTPWDDQKLWPMKLEKKTDAPPAKQAPTAASNSETPGKISCADFAKKLWSDYSKNYSPFKKLWIYNRKTLVFDGFNDSIRKKTVAIDVAVLPDSVNVTLFMRDGNLADVQAFVNGDKTLKTLFPEIVAERLRHSHIPYAEVSAFIDKVLAEFRW